MADVFLSYRNTPERRAFVKRLALLLRAHEVSVWWDYGLEAGESYRAQILEEIDKARIVAPMWCEESILSEWVAREADLGKQKLVPARLQKVRPPMAFEAIQAADLVGWDGAVDHPRALAFVRKICERLSKPPTAPIDMMEELADLRPLKPLPEAVATNSKRSSFDQDAVLADLRTTWAQFPARHESWAVERFLARVRGTAPGSGLEFEVEHALEMMRVEAVRREQVQRSQEDARRREAEELAAAAAEELRRRRPGAEFRDGEGLPLLVTIPAGKFSMGSPDSEEDRFLTEGPSHEVRISRRLAVGKYPVTVGEFRLFIEASGYNAGAELRDGFESGIDEPFIRSWRDPGFSQDDRHPVTCVNWHDAKAYVGWISRATAREYRLPTEAEWEYACRAGTQTRYAFGNNITAELANFLNTRPGTTPVGSYPANSFRLHDMHGNVWEWCEDFWNSSHMGAPTDGSARLNGNESLRVLRGGSWNFVPQLHRSAYRFGSMPSGRYFGWGFRVARTLS